MEVHVISEQSLLQDRAIGAMLGAACGDALGWPNERASGHSSKKGIPKGKLVEFKQWIRRSGGRFYPHDEVIEAGDYSDDTQLILCLCRSLPLGEDWWRHFTQVELPLWTLYERGGGGATKRAAAAWAEVMRPWSPERTADEARKYFEAGGNGVSMRVLPHVIFHANSESFQVVSKNIMLDGIATHGHPRALVGALGYGYALWKSIRRNVNLGFGEIVQELLASISEWANLPEGIEPFNEWSSSANQFLPRYRDIWDRTTQEMEDFLKTCARELSKGALIIDIDVLRDLQCFDQKTNGAGTVATATAVFLASRYAPDPMCGLTKAANAIGADTDTIASMTGGLLGTIGGSGWLSPLKNKVQDSEYLAKVASNLASGKYSSSLVHGKTRETRLELDKWVDHLFEKPDGTDIELPDGRAGKVFRRDDSSGKSGKFKVLFRKVVCVDGQNLHFKKINKAGNPPGTNTGMPRHNGDPEGVPQTLNFGPKLLVRSLEESIWFYNEVLGLRIKKRTKELAVFEKGLVLVPSDYTADLQDGSQFRFLIYMEAFDIEHRLSLAKENNVKIVTPLSQWKNSMRRYFRCSDPDGNIIEVFSST